jgi:hypothetical protein
VPISEVGLHPLVIFEVVIGIVGTFLEPFAITNNDLFAGTTAGVTEPQIIKIVRLSELPSEGTAPDAMPFPNGRSKVTR